MTNRLIAAAAIGLLLSCVRASAADPAPAAKPEPPGGDALKLDEFYTDPLSRAGSFPGTLVCISTKQPNVPENVTPCGADKVYALSIAQPQIVVPVKAAADVAADRFAELLNQRVVIRGKHYPDKSIIAAGSIERASTAADAPAEPR